MDEKIAYIKHGSDTRTNIPTEELRDFVADDEQQPIPLIYKRDTSLDPQLVWKGKDEQDQNDLAVPVVPIYIQEKIHPQVIINDLLANGRKSQGEDGLYQDTFLKDFNGGPDEFEEKVDFYHHEQHWTNRMILGDSLLVMSSLAEKEGLRGKVQCIYIDPPYGIKFGSNWQVSTRKRTRNSGGKEAMIKELTHLVPMQPKDTDADLHLLNLMNGIYNLDTGELLPHDRTRYITRIAPVEFDPHAQPPKRWINFMSEIMDGNADMIRFLQKAVGYSLTGHTFERCMFILYGSGANGKSVFMNVLRELVGNYLANAQPETVMLRERSSGSAATSDIARLKGARIVTTEEPEEGRRIAEGLVKHLTGGTAITCRFLFGKDFEYTPTYKIWMATNHKPIVRNMDNGIWSRLRLVPFTVTFPPEKQDRGLLEKLKAELPGILNWALEGHAMGWLASQTDMLAHDWMAVD